MPRGTVFRFCAICGVERETPEPLLDVFAGAPGLIANALEHASAGQPAGWSPREVIAHLADSEINFGARVRQILSEDAPVILPYDQERWAQALRYGERDSALALNVFRAVRASNIELVRDATPADWQRTYLQPPDGWAPAGASGTFVRHTLDDLVRHRADHDLQHLGQITGET